MGGGHRLELQGLVVPGDSRVHRIPPEVKLVAVVLFVTAVACTPRRQVWAFVVDAAMVAGAARLGRIPAAVLIRRVLIVAPFLVVALLLPFVSHGADRHLGPVAVSTVGMWASWNIAAKALLGASASVLLTATTTIPDLLAGMTRLRVPPVVIAIVAFMFRYLDLIVDQFHRMRTAMTARCYEPRWLWEARPLAASAGTLFVRSFERGERVHHAMLARGFTGTMPELESGAARWRAWPGPLAPSLAAVALAVVAALR